MILPLHRLHGELRQRLFVHCRGKASLPLRPASPALDLERGILLQASDLADQSTGGSVDVGVKGKPVVIRAGVEIDYYPVLAPDHSSGKINPGPTGQYLHRSEERRVGKECVSTCRYRWSPGQSKKKKKTRNRKKIKQQIT